MARDFALPGTRAQYLADRKFDVRHIRIEVDLSFSERTIAGTCRLTVAPIIDRARWLELDAVELDIVRVNTETEELDFSHDGRVLRIDLGSPARGESIDVEVHYEGQPRRGLYFVGPDDGYPDRATQAWTQGQDDDSRFWFPCVDRPHEKATTEVITTVPEGYFALSNGDLIERVEQDEGRQRFHWRHDAPHSAYLVTLVAGRFEEIRERWEDVDVTYYAEPRLAEAAQRTCKRTPEMLDLFSKRFGVRYPYGKYAQIFVGDFIFGGMENTTATTLTDVVLLDERASLDFDFENLIAHELAHQWFGDLLTCRDWGEGWLNEGFATYSEYIWREHAEGRDAAALELEDFAAQYFSEDANRYRRTIATRFYEVPLDIFDRHLYDKGARILHMLRQILGEDDFWPAITHYLEKHHQGSVETRDLARAIEEKTGRVLDWFFDQWVTQGSGHPELDIELEWHAETCIATATVRQNQKVEGSTPLFRIPTTLRVRVGGEDIDYPIVIRDSHHTFSFALDEEPTQLIFDPGKHVLAALEVHKSAAWWQEEVAEATEGIDRIYAARQLGKIGGTAATAALIEALTEDPFWGVQAAAAEALGCLRTLTARDALIAAIETTDNPKARRAVVKALGQFRRDGEVETALSHVIRAGDASYFVEAEACLALGKTRGDSAPTFIRSALERDSYRDVIRQACYRGLAEARDETAIPLLMDATSYGGDTHGRRAAMEALARLAAGRTDRAAEDIRDRLEELLFDRDFRVQGAAVEGLAVIASARSIPALKELAGRDLDGRLRRRSREVVRDIEEGRAQREQVESLRDELEKTRSQLATLRERVEKLETHHEQRAASVARAESPTSTRRTRRPGGGKKQARPR